MLINTNENKILKKALNNFVKDTGLEIKIIDWDANTLNRKIDAMINIEGQNCIVEVKTNINNATIAMMIAVQENVTEKLIFVTRYVTQNMAKVLKQYNIQFIDVAGNAYINLPPIYIDITGKQNVNIKAQREKKRAFKQTGLKVIFALLNNPHLIKTTYRNIAKEANVALGTVNWIMRELKQEMFVIDKGDKGRVLNNELDLYNRWVIAYPDRLREKLVLGQYTAKNPEWWKRVKITDFDAQWGGEVGAARITKYLEPEDITIYIDENHITDFILEHNLIQDPNGNIEFLRKFWENDKQVNNEVVPHILVYADLIKTRDPRNIETAKIIYENEKIRYI